MEGLHKLLQRQIRKIFPEGTTLTAEVFHGLIAVVNESYASFEKDKALASQAFAVAEQEFSLVHEKLLAEKHTREQGLEKLRATLRSLDWDGQTNTAEEESDLLWVIDYINEEVNKRLEVEKQLQRSILQTQKASRAKSDFLSTMSHEIRSPLNVIIGMTHVLQKNHHLPEQAKNLEVLGIASRNLMTLINDILDFNKIEEGKVELEYHDFNFFHLVNDVKKANEHAARERGNSLKLFIDSDVQEFVCADSVRINQVVTNLVSNAVKFTRDGEIRLTVSLLEDYTHSQLIRVEVSDTGIGISVENQKRILERFTQAHQHTTREYGGTGLGLSITQLLLSLMGSEIKIHSIEGKGTTFYFDLILQQGQAHIAEGLDQPGNAKNLVGKWVLVVDDLEFNVLMLEQIIGDWNLRIDVATNGLEAVEMTTKNAYDLILMDLQMPVMDGKQATLAIRQFNQHIPIIALTASSNQNTKVELLAAGMNDYIAKPFNPDVLYQRMQRWLLGMPTISS